MSEAYETLRAHEASVTLMILETPATFAMSKDYVTPEEQQVFATLEI